MPKFKRPCLICGELGYGSHCDVHAYQVKRIRDDRKNTPQRLAKKKALYGGDYQRRRAAALANADYCYLCNEPFQAGDRVEADHVYPGDPSSPLLPSHRACNQRKSNKTTLN